MMNRSFIESVLQEQPGKYVAVSSKHDGIWKDYISPSVTAALDWLESQPEGADLYWCPIKFSGNHRRKQLAADSRFLYADLDEADPKKLLPRPTQAWESSPGRWQALWRLESPLPPAELEALNKRMTYGVGADRGGWDLTQVLRVPGTVNNKYKQRPHVKLLWSESRTISSRVISEEPTTIDRVWRDTLTKHFDRIPRKVMSTLTAKRATQGKRSEVLWWLAHELTAAKVPAKDVLVLVRGSVWNKYEGRSDELTRLKSEIAAALARKRPEAPKITEELLPIVTHRDLMLSPGRRPGWLVEDWWVRESHGIVAGEPKSFKSFLVQDLALSVASGKPFLNKYEVRQTGHVLMIQAENAEWMLRDRANKISYSKDLLGRGLSGDTLELPQDLPISYVNLQAIDLLNPDDRDKVEATIRYLKPVLIVLDPLYLMFSGEVNSAQELNPILSWLLFIKSKYKSSLILVHHMGKNKLTGRRAGQRMLGSTTLHGFTDSAWYIDVQASEDTAAYLTIDREFRATGIYPQHHLRVSVGAWGTADYEVEHNAKPRQVDKEVRANEIAEVIETAGKAVSLRQIAEISGLSKRQVARGVEQALADKLIKLTDDGYIWVG